MDLPSEHGRADADIKPLHPIARVLVFHILPATLLLFAIFGGGWRSYAVVAFVVYVVAMAGYGRDAAGYRAVFGRRKRADETIDLGN